jgi:hypothetical protein
MCALPAIMALQILILVLMQEIFFSAAQQSIAISFRRGQPTMVPYLILPSVI